MARAAPNFWRTRSFVAALLLPLSAIFALLAGLRRLSFRLGLRRSVRIPVPVIVVGNIAVGGSGKTPAVEWIVSHLRAAGFSPGIVSRGYLGQVDGVELVSPEGKAAHFGDEPVLLARLTGCPVAVGADRPAAAMALLAARPECDVIVADDGLQHYRLARDVEVAVVDASTLGNGWLLPAGPLRERMARLRDVDLTLSHGPLPVGLERLLAERSVYSMRLEGHEFRSLSAPGESCDATAFIGRKVHAIAGIGRPERFFNQLRAMGLEVAEHPFPDHHHFIAADLSFAPGEPKIVTSKDAVKCVAFAPANTWEFPVTARIDPGAAEKILEKLGYGRKTA